MSAGETDLRRGLAVLDQYREQIETLGQQQDLVRMSLEDHMRARETLDQYQKAGRGAEVLVPVGANSFLVAESKDVDRAFVSIGSDLVVHDEIPKQIERLDARIKSITEAANAIGQRLADLQRRAEAQGAAVQDLYDRIQTTGRRGERN
jgi:prefoldin alpha subunit